MFRILLIVLAILVGLVLVRFWTLPDRVQHILVSKYLGQPKYSLTVYSGVPVETTQVHEVRIYKGFFTLDRLLDPDETRELVRILRDTTNYDSNQPGENMDAEELIFVYFDKKGLLLGESHLNRHGELLTVPLGLIGRSGYLTNDGLRELSNAIE